MRIAEQARPSTTPLITGKSHTMLPFTMAQSFEGADLSLGGRG